MSPLPSLPSLSVRQGTAGSPAPLTRLQTGLAAQAYRTATGAATPATDTTTDSPSIFASAQTNVPSAPAPANPLTGPPSAVFRPSAWSKASRTAPPVSVIDRNTGP